MLRKSFCILTILAIASISSIFVGSARADVYPQSPFHYEGFGGVYDGICTTNITDGHFINTCHATFVKNSGTKVSQTTMLSGPNLHGIISPSGQMTEIVVLQK